jgi:hypothetical protein
MGPIAVLALAWLAIVYSFVGLSSNYYSGSDFLYLYFNEGWVLGDDPVTIYCSDNLIQTRPDRAAFYHALRLLNVARPAEIPIYFGVFKDKIPHYWSFREWRFVPMDPYSTSKESGLYLLKFDQCTYEK